MMGSLFAVLTLWTLYYGWKEKRISPNILLRSTALALLFFILALFSKETSAGICLGVFALFWAMEPATTSFIARIWKVVRHVLPFAMLGILYVVMRTSASSVMPSYGPGIYQVYFGANIFRNIALFALQTVLPFSSALTMNKVYDRDFFSLAGILIVTGFFAWFWIYGIWKSERRQFILILLGFAFLSLVPAVFLNHVSESYLYNALPYLMVVFGFIVEYYWNAAPRRVAIAFALVLAVAFVTNISGSMEKTSALAEESSRAQVLMPQIYPIVSALPRNGRLYLVNPVTEEFEYSVFAMKGFGPVKYADPWIERYTRRPDVQMYVLDSLEYRDSSARHPGAAFTMDKVTFQIKPF
jgi:hypothetical protein